jgi:hypothetical protein
MSASGILLSLAHFDTLLAASPEAPLSLVRGESERCRR